MENSHQFPHRSETLRECRISMANIVECHSLPRTAVERHGNVSGNHTRTSVAATGRISSAERPASARLNYLRSYVSLPATTMVRLHVRQGARAPPLGSPLYDHHQCCQRDGGDAGDESYRHRAGRGVHAADACENPVHQGEQAARAPAAGRRRRSGRRRLPCDGAVLADAGLFPHGNLSRVRWPLFVHLRVLYVYI
jgi:hypothetical protein